MDESGVKQETLSRSAATLGEVSRELANWVPILRRLAEAEVLRDLALGHSFEITSCSVRSIITARRLREQYFWPSITEAAWTVILELFVNRLEGRRMTIEGLSLATETPLDAVQHWTDWLAGRGIVSRSSVSDDDAEALVDLTDTGADRVRSYLIAALNLSPWVQ